MVPMKMNIGIAVRMMFSSMPKTREDMARNWMKRNSSK